MALLSLGIIIHGQPAFVLAHSTVGPGSNGVFHNANISGLWVRERGRLPNTLFHLIAPQLQHFSYLDR